MSFTTRLTRSKRRRYEEEGLSLKIPGTMTCVDITYNTRCSLTSIKGVVICDSNWGEITRGQQYSMSETNREGGFDTEEES